MPLNAELIIKPEVNMVLAISPVKNMAVSLDTERQAI
jgi:hypothetical protein